MKYGKYDLHKFSNNVSIGTSYSWYYRGNRANDAKKAKRKKLTRTSSDSTLFSDYANQVKIFDKSASDKRASKVSNRVNKASNANADNVSCSFPLKHILECEPRSSYNENVTYGLPTLDRKFYNKGGVFSELSFKSDLETCSTGTAACSVPENELDLYVKNPLYSYSSDKSAYASLANLEPAVRTATKTCKKKLPPSKSRSRNARRNSTEELRSSILKDYTRKMYEWNNTLSDYYCTLPYANGEADGANTSSDYAKTMHSSFSCRKLRKKSYCISQADRKINCDNHDYYSYCTKYRRPKLDTPTSHSIVDKSKSLPNMRETKGSSGYYSLHGSGSLKRNTSYSTLMTLKRKAQFWKKHEDNAGECPSICECLHSLYDSYDRRLKEWCDNISDSSLYTMGYKEEIVNPDNAALVPPGLIGKADVLFGNLHELFTFHSDVFLKDLESSISTTELVALCFVQKRETFFRLYSYYCQNIPRSERLREALVDTHLFLQACQLKLGHKLPLAAYLLKPVQRITKYQLLLKDLLRYSECGTVQTGLQEALDCMLVVLKCVNDSMHQIAITGFPVDLSQQGELLMQGSFSVVTDSKRDIRLRLKTRQRHIFLYQKAMLFCKPAAKNNHNKATYHFKHYLQMSQIGLTESVKGDGRRFEVWLQGRAEVHTISAPNVATKQAWVAKIKRVLLDQLEELKGERVRQYASGQIHRPLRQAASWEANSATDVVGRAGMRALSCDTGHEGVTIGMATSERPSNGAGHHPDDACWSSDCSNSDEEDTYSNEHQTPPRPGTSLIALADYCAVGPSEVSLHEGEVAELLKVGCAGWWFVRLSGGSSSGEGWAPAAYLDHRKTSRSSSRSQDRLIEH